jgi:uncharacterized protein
MKFNILDLLLPRETKFFAYMSQLTDIFVEGCRAFSELVSHIETLREDEIRTRLSEVKNCESRGDKIEYQIIHELHKTFITPIDREDIHTITINIDKALDILYSIARKVEIYNIRKVPDNVGRFAGIIVSIAEKLQQLMKALGEKAAVNEIIENMHSLENDADELFHVSMAELFTSDKFSPVEIIKFKEFYEHLENVVDSADYVGKLVRGVRVKQG